MREVSLHWLAESPFQTVLCTALSYVTPVCLINVESISICGENRLILILHIMQRSHKRKTRNVTSPLLHGAPAVYGKVELLSTCLNYLLIQYVNLRF